MFEVKKIYPDHSLHLISFDFDEKGLRMIIINDKKEMIQKIKVSFFNALYEVECDSSENVLDLSISNVRIESSFCEPEIISYFTDGNECVLDYSSREEIITMKRSLSKLQDEKYIYRNKLQKISGMERKNIKFFPEDNSFYWVCPCGQYNLSSQEKCLSCQSEKKKIFADKIDYSQEEYYKRNIVKISYLLLTLLFPLYVFYFTYIYLLGSGDLLFSNELFFTLWGKVNTYGTLILYPLLSGLIIFFRKRYMKGLTLGTEIMRLVLLAYINIMLLSQFVTYSYLFPFVLLFDFYAVYYYSYILYKKIIRKYEIGILISVSACLIASFGELIAFKRNTMSVKKDGISLVCKANKKVYEIPDKIDGVNVSYVTFSSYRDYSSIEELVIPKSLKAIYISSSAVLPCLEKITISEENTNFYNHNGVLFYKSGKTALVPQMLREVTIDWEEVNDASFADCYHLESVEITSDVKKIGDNAFSYCTSLSDLDFSGSSSLTEIGNNAFEHCVSLVNVFIPDNVEKIGDSILKDCSGVKYLKLPFLGNRAYDDYDYSNKNALGYTFGADYRMSSYDNLDLKEVTITSLKVMANAAFYGCNAEKINFSLKGTSIGVNAFYSSYVKELVISEGVETLGDSCFENCYYLEKISLPSTLKKVGKNAFKNCIFLTDIDISALDTSSLIIEEGNEVLEEYIKKNAEY